MPAPFPFYHIGHFINRPHHPAPFALTRFGSMAEPAVEDPHKHTFYEVIWITGGATTQVIDYRYFQRTGSSPGRRSHEAG